MNFRQVAPAVPAARAGTRVPVRGLGVILALLLLAVRAGAHPLIMDQMWVRFEPGCIRVAVNVSLREIAIVEGDALDGNHYQTIRGSADRHAGYLLSHLKLSAQEDPLPGRVARISAPPAFLDPEATFFQYDLEYPLGERRPLEVVFVHEMLKEWSYAPATAWSVSYVARVRSFGSPGFKVTLLANDKPVPLATGLYPASWSQGVNPPIAAGGSTAGVFGDYLRHGIVHILTGYDHLLFVSALVIATLSFWEMAQVIAAFTLAHTLTLALSVFGVLRLPSAVVEPVISLSIVVVALENIVWPERAHSRIRLAVAFGFGLIHGLGFAGGLLDAMAGLPPIGTWVALGAFSLGVELGHQCLVLPLFGALLLGRRRLPERTCVAGRRCLSAAISCAGAYYLLVALKNQGFFRL